MAWPTTKGLTEPQRDGKSFIGAYIAVSEKRKLYSYALAAGVSISAVLRAMIGELEIDTLQAAKKKGG